MVAVEAADELGDPPRPRRRAAASVEEIPAQDRRVVPVGDVRVDVDVLEERSDVLLDVRLRIEPAGGNPGHRCDTTEGDRLGVPMYFSGYAAEDSRRFLVDAGLEIETFQYETILEKGRPTRFLWVVARKPRGS